MDTDSLYMALSEDKVEKLVRLEMKLMWEANRENDYKDDLRADENDNFFPQKQLPATMENRPEETWTFQIRI